ncbi:hypothetical protein DSL72_009354 [Monilinia vaccinii-corymbosi]|uniref:C2H2-type domain-containing protein n=1 Tax=Monilinia vaccinii-corymbosi TaxID=61207 RepID=A0A8A3PQ44_9HELO|nr:hypothetical protein DSL72_009354 [Monilinia vaccinii-corymbosi]
MSSSESSKTLEPRAIPCFNYQLPQRIRYGKNKGYIIIPNFNTATGPVNQNLAIAKNSEFPNLLKAAGHLTKEEDESIYCHEVESGQPYYISAAPEDDNPIHTLQYFNQQDVKAITPAFEAMKEARKIALRRGTGPNSRKGIPAFEQLMSTCRSSSRRSYPQGFTITPQEDSICAAPVNAAMMCNAESTGNINRLIAIAATHLLESCAPREVLEHLAKQADAAVPLTVGDEHNKYFSTIQYNYSDADVASLELSIGEVGALHIDSHDDPTLWTVLLILSNIPEGYWPGRTFVSSLRVYATMGPMTALVFKAVHPHISLGPISMGNSTREPYVSVLPKSIQTMDPELYQHSRLVAVCYPKKAIMRQSPTLIRRSTPAILHRKNGLRSSLPEAHPVAIAAFGTRRNQMEYLARLETHDMMIQVRINTALIMPSADWFAHKWRWREEDGGIMTPSVSRIQAVIDGLSDEDAQWYTAYKEKCEDILSMKWFGRQKNGNSHWVSTQEIGSTFADADPSEQTTAEAQKDFNKRLRHFTDIVVLKRQYGNKPFKCPSCEARFGTKQGCKVHHDRQHKETHEWQIPSPSLDPTHQLQAELASNEDGEGEEAAAETSGEDKEASEDEAPLIQKRKRTEDS